MHQRLELIAGTSAKFWEVTVSDCTVTTRWGRIGSNGQTKSKDHPTEAKALADAEKQAAKKRAKGYASPGETANSPVETAPSGPTSGELTDGQEVQVKGSGSRHYTLKNTGGVYSCTCPAWLHQSIPIDARTCKHLRAFRGDAAETARLGSLPQRARRSTASADAPPVLLAHNWEGQDPTGWWLSEKLDGVRAWWDGTQFLSRQGNAFLAPAWFTEALPEAPLDGELFGGRGKFQTTVSIARRADAGDRWKQLEFVIFDAPEFDGTFEERIEHARSLELGTYARVLEQSLCKSESQLQRALKQIEDLGGEGVMLRRPGSRYESGRSDSLLKVKTFHDAEAVVVAHQPGKGRHAGRLGALVVQLPDGTEFKVGTGFSDAERAQPPAIGTTITFRYQELTRDGVPRFPSYLRVRE